MSGFQVLVLTMLDHESLAAHASRRSRRSLLSMRLLCFNELDLILRGSPTGRANARPMTGSVAVSKDGLQYRFVIPGSKYPPAEPGALGIGPLEAAVRVADAALHSLATRRWPISATNSFGPSGRPLAPGS